MQYEAKLIRSRALIETAAREFSPAVCASSLGLEDMVLMDLIARWAPSINIFTLDTGRLPQETYELIERAEQHFRRRIRVYTPEAAAVEAYVRLNGINGFYQSVTQRMDCCHVRKVEPLRRALSGSRAWLTGLRREQAASRNNLAETEFDTVHGIQKFNPLIDWSLEEIRHHIDAHRLPYNALHDRGYPSIGCAPCTRAVTPGEDVRAGRWWWERGQHQECGIHLQPPRPEEALHTS